MSERSPDKRRFTLVELLVVMAIVSILAAMLLPTLMKSMAAARTIACANNQKQHYLAFLAYAEDHGGLLPSTNITMNGYALLGWMNTLCRLKYIPGGSPDPGWDSSVAMGLIDATYLPQIKTVFCCPVLQKQYSYWDWFRGGTYAMNSNWFPSSISVPGDAFFKISTALAPSRLFLEGEKSVGCKSVGIQFPYPQEKVINHHDGRGNYVYLDGHYQSRAMLPRVLGAYAGWYGFLPYFNTTVEAP